MSKLPCIKFLGEINCCFYMSKKNEHVICCQNSSDPQFSDSCPDLRPSCFKWWTKVSVGSLASLCWYSLRGLISHLKIKWNWTDISNMEYKISFWFNLAKFIETIWFICQMLLHATFLMILLKTKLLYMCCFLNCTSSLQSV